MTKKLLKKLSITVMSMIMVASFMLGNSVQVLANIGDTTERIETTESKDTTSLKDRENSELTEDENNDKESLSSFSAIQSSDEVFRLNSVTGISNEDTIYSFLNGTLGIGCAGCCGILGNMYVESRFSPEAHNTGENAWGICQWEGGRLDALQSLFPNSWKTLSSQLDFLSYELNGGDYAGPKALEYIKNVEDTTAGAQDAAYYFAKYFERCASSSFSKRKDWAATLHDGRHGTIGHEVDASYGGEFVATAIVKMNVWTLSHSEESNRWIDVGDECIIHEVYTDGCCYVSYPSSASSTGMREAYASISNFRFGNQAPAGMIDSASGGEGVVSVSGWAFDPDSPGESIAVHVYIDGPAGSGTFAGMTTANLERSDVNNQYGITGNHGYEVTVPVSAGRHSVFVHAIDTSGGDNPYLGYSGTKVTVSENKEPNISDIKITNKSASGYTVTCKVTDGSGISSVKFPTWNTNLGTSYAKWYEGTINGDRVTCTIYYDELGETSKSQRYHTHIYAYDQGGALKQADAGAVEPDKVKDLLSPASNFSDDFFAVICNKASESTTTQGQFTAFVLTKDTTDNADFYQLSEQNNRDVVMHFKKNSDGTYRISPLGDEGLSLDVYSALSTNQANVNFYENNDTDAQRWNIYESKNGYYLTPVCAPTACLDLTNGTAQNGQNAQIYNYNTGAGPAMSIQVFNKVSLEDFCTEVKSIGSGTYLTSQAKGDTFDGLIFSSKSDSKKQGWHFVYDKGNDAYYIHPDYSDDVYLHVVGGTGTGGTEVGLYSKVSTTSAQLWDLYEWHGHYYLKPRCSSTAFLDVISMSSDDVDARIWDFNFNQGFDFYIKKSKVKVTFDANGGSVGITSKTIIVNEAYGELPVPVYKGHDFKGWYTAGEGGKLVSAEMICEGPEDVILYAHWTKAKGDIDLNDLIDILDARLAKRIAMKDPAVKYTQEGFDLGDLDGNGKITINEARKIMRVVLKETTL